MPYKHPLIVSWLKVFGWKVSGTGKIFAGLGCPNGCDFCCTSHFFRRKHIRLLPTGDDIYRVIERYLDVDPQMNILIVDEVLAVGDAEFQRKCLGKMQDVAAGGGEQSPGERDRVTAHVGEHAAALLPRIPEPRGVRTCVLLGRACQQRRAAARFQRRERDGGWPDVGRHASRFWNRSRR